MPVFGAQTSQGYRDLGGLGAGGATTPLDLTGPSVSGSNTYMLFCCSVNGDAQAPSGATYNAVSLGTPLADLTFNGSSHHTVWGVVAPASAATFSVTFPAAVTENAVLVAAYWTDVNQATPTRTATTAQGTTNPATASVTNSVAGDLIAEFFGLDNTLNVDGMTSARIGAGQTFRVQISNSTGEANTSLAEEAGASGTVTASWDFVDNIDSGWVLAAIPLIPPAGGSGDWRRALLTEFPPQRLAAILASRWPGAPVGGVNNPLAVSVTSTQTPTITKGVGLPRSLTETQTASVTKAMAKTLAVTSSQLASVAKNVARAAVTLTETQTVSRTVATTFARTFSVVSTQTASIVKNVGLPRALTETQTASLAKTTGKNVALTETQTASITKNVGITRSVTSTQTVTAIIGRAFVKVISVTSTQAASIVKTVGLNRAVTSTQTPSIVKGVGKNVAVTETQVPAITKNVALTRSVTETQTVAATIGRAFVKVITVTQTQTASIVKRTGKTIAVTSTQTPSVTKAIAKTILATVTQTVTRIINVVTSGPPSTATQVRLSYVEQSSLTLSAAPVNTGAVTLTVVESSLDLSVEEQ